MLRNSTRNSAKAKKLPRHNSVFTFLLAGSFIFIIIAGFFIIKTLIVDDMKYVIFEDNKYTNLYPLNLLRASFDLKAGVFSMKDRIERFLPVGESITLFVRDEISNLAKVNNKNPINQIPDEDSIFLNGRVVFSQRFLNWVMKDMSVNSVLHFEDTVVAAKLSVDEINKRRENLKFCMEQSFFDGFKEHQ